jgi:hypothetical protein
MIMMQKRRWKTGARLFCCKNAFQQILFITIGILTYVASSFAANDAPLPWPDDNPTAEQLDIGLVPVPSDEAVPAPTTRAIRMLAPAQSFGSPWVAQGPGPAIDGQVENLSPAKEVTGAVHVVLPHPTDADILFAAGANGGVWKTSNATAESPSWSPLTDALPSLSIGALDFDYNDSSYQTLVAGVGRFSSFYRDGGGRTGIYKTTDGGAVWTHLNGGTTLNDKNISGVAARGGTILASINYAVPFYCSDIGVFRSTDGGSSFTQLTWINNGMPAGVVFDLEGHPNQPATLYSAVKYAAVCDIGANGIYKSTDTGLTWSKVSDAAIDALITNNDTSNIEIAVYDNGQGVSVVYVAILNSGQLINGGVFHSANGGGAWTQMDVLQSNTPTPVGTNPRYKPDAGLPGGQGDIHFSIEPDPSSSQIVYVGGDRQPHAYEEGMTSGPYFPNSIGARDYSGRLFRGDRSQGSGSQWVHLTHVQDQHFVDGGTMSSSAPHADSREMAFDANGNLIEGDDGGIYRRSLPGNNTGDWYSINGNLCVTEIHDIAYDSRSNSIISGNQDTGTTYQPAQGAAQWKSLSTGDGGDVAVDNVTLAAIGQSIRYSSYQNLGLFLRSVWDANGDLVGSAYPLLNGFSGNKQFVTPLELNRIEPARLVFGGSERVNESLDQGENVTALTPDITAEALAYGGVASGVENADVLWVAGYVGSTPAVKVRTSSGAALAPTAYLGAVPVDIVMDPDDWHTAYVIDVDGKLWRTTDTGTTFQDVTGTLSDVGALRSLEYFAGGNGEYLLVGADAGVFIASLGAFNSWKELGDNLPNAPVYDMTYDAIDDVLVAGTLGRGAWTIPKFGKILDTPEFNSSISSILLLLLGDD